MVDDLGDGSHVPVVKVLGGGAGGGSGTTATWEDAGYTLDANGNLKSETQVNSSTGATRTRTWTYTTSGSDTVATPGAWA